MVGSNFKIGDEVEVTSPIHNMRGALFPAKIIGKLRDKTKLKVEYNKVKAKIDRKISRRNRHHPQRNEVEEEVDVALIRPLPPGESKYCCFKLGDVVDAFFCGGWWEGVVTDVLKDSTFGVYFRFAKEIFEFESEELRLHREWVKGSWLPPLQQGVSMPMLIFMLCHDSIQGRILILGFSVMIALLHDCYRIGYMRSIGFKA